ncbi:MAG: DUF485 domain-containing protein [Armatimonadota bacterium]
MLHEPATPVGKDPAAPYKAKLGIWMFLLYAIFYVGFVVINLYNPLLMEKIILFGLNLATVYGFSLIIVALILALIYDKMCASRESALDNSTDEEAN